ncbi:MAG: transglutaminase domain-containing protein [Candidatus Omnitrophota bacterium]
MESKVKVRIAEEIKNLSGVVSLTWKMPEFPEVTVGPNQQSIEEYQNTFSVQPKEIKKEKDDCGNTFFVFTWENPPDSLRILTVFTGRLSVSLPADTPAISYPLSSLSLSEQRYLEPTPLVQADNEEVRTLSRQLISGATTESEAVRSIMNWVVDNITYQSEPPEKDALWTLKNKRGNCTNYSHLSLALLRSVGIPARAVAGLALKKHWSVPIAGGTLTQDMQEGWHAWIEVYYPRIGWLPYDPQQTQDFVSSHHIRAQTGLDLKEITRGFSYQYTSPRKEEPEWTTSFESRFQEDRNTFVYKDEFKVPRNYILASLGLQKPSGKPPVLPVKPPLPPPAPTPAPTPPPAPRPVEPVPFEIGFFDLGGSMDQYATSNLTYGQGFSLEKEILLDNISLALHKFGGSDGMLWVELRKEEKGKPAGSGKKSQPIPINLIETEKGYPWITFDFGEKISLSPGTYWILLRYSGDAIFNWHCQPGNGYGTPDDTRFSPNKKSLPLEDWNNIINIDFNFRVFGSTSP